MKEIKKLIALTPYLYSRASYACEILLEEPDPELHEEWLKLKNWTEDYINKCEQLLPKLNSLKTCPEDLEMIKSILLSEIS